MNSILSLILKPIYECDPMYHKECSLKENNHPHMKDYLRRNYKKMKCRGVCIHPSMAEIVLENRELIDLHYIFYNSSSLLTEVILSRCIR